jgi:cobalt-zinc-cadmium efflux system outer membrane protein
LKSRCAAVAVLGTALLVGISSHAAADDGMTLDDALARARERSLDVLAARRRVAEAEARLSTRPALRDNPVLEGAVGARDRLPDDFEVGVSQTFELGGRGGSRRDIERAGLAREQAEAAQVERAVLRDVRAAFLRGLYAAERLRLARSMEADAAELVRIARRRHEAGDVAALDLNVAGSAASRARAEVKAAEAAQASALGELRVMLVLDPSEPLALAGPLRQARAYDAAALQAAIAERPEIRALEAQLLEAEAEARLGKGHAWPDLTPALRYERDEGERVLWAGLSVSLPLFERGQQMRAVSEVRAERLRSELVARKRVLATQVAGTLGLFDLRQAAVGELEANASTLADSETLARRSYEVGQIGLAELLLVRREAAEARRQWLDSLLELATVRAELDALAGGSR